MYKEIKWGQNGIPQNQTINDILTMLRNDDLQRGLLYDAPTLDDVLSQAEDVNALDGIVVDNAHLKNKMLAMRRVMNMTANSEQQVAGDPIISEPFMRAGTAQVAVIFSLVDGQAVTIYFHNPDADPKRIKPTDELVSFKFLLNKKDITIVVAPENGQDINIRQVAMRIMKLAEKNSSAFQRQNVKNAERKALISDLEAKINQKKAILTQKLETISQLESQLENPKGSDNNESTLEPEMAAGGDSNDELPTQDVDLVPKTENDLPEDKTLKTIVGEKEARSLIKQGYVPLRNQPTSHLGELITDIKDNILPKYPTISIDDFSINDLFQRAVLELKDNKTKENFLRIEEEPDGGDVGYKVTSHLYLTNEEAHFSSYDRYDKALEYVNTEIKNYVSSLPEQAETEGSDRSNNGNDSEKTAETEKTNNLRNEKLKEVKAFLKTLQGKMITASDGVKILFNSRNSTKHLSFDANFGEVESEAVKRIVETFEQGKPLGREKLYKERKDKFVGFYAYEKWLDLKKYRVKVIAKAGIKENGSVETSAEEVIAYTQKVKAKLSLSSGGVSENTQPLDHDKSGFAGDNTPNLDSVQEGTDEGLRSDVQKIEATLITSRSSTDKSQSALNRDQLRVATDDATANFDGTQEEWADNDALLTIVDIEPLNTPQNPAVAPKAAVPDESLNVVDMIEGEVKPFATEREKELYFYHYEDLRNNLRNFGQTPHNPVQLLSQPSTKKAIIERVSGGDKTRGSCVSLALAYAANRLGLDVLDFRGGHSQSVMSGSTALWQAFKMAHCNPMNFSDYNVPNMLKNIQNVVQEGEEYGLGFGTHFAIVRKYKGQFQYLELQSPILEENTFITLKKPKDFYNRFSKSRKPRTSVRNKKPAYACLYKLSDMQNTAEFRDILGYINTKTNEQQKGADGHEK